MTAAELLAALPQDVAAELRLSGGRGGLALVHVSHYEPDFRRLEVVRLDTPFELLAWNPPTGDEEVLAVLPLRRGSSLYRAELGRLAAWLEVPLAEADSSHRDAATWYFIPTGTR